MIIIATQSKMIHSLKEQQYARYIINLGNGKTVGAAGLIEIKRRIKSVESTRKITKAMGLVAPL